MKTNFEIASTTALTPYDKELDEELDRACEMLELMIAALENRISKQKSTKTFVICAKMGNQEDWGWEEVNRTTDLNEALSAVKAGARVYEDHSEHGWCALMPLSTLPVDMDELPF